MNKRTGKRFVVAATVLGFAVMVNTIFGNMVFRDASAAYSDVSDGNPNYTLHSTDWKAVGFTKTRTTFKVPERFRRGGKTGQTITVLGKRVFANCKKLKKVYLSKYTKYVGERAFVNCRNLKKVEFSVADGQFGYINPYAFANCSSLQSISIPDVMGDDCGVYEGVFKGCTSLKKVKLPANNPYIGDYTFYNCRKLKEIELPESAQYIGKYAFAKCVTLKEIDIPEGVTEIKASAFSGCTKLKSITIPYTVTNIGASAFNGCKGTIICDKPECDAEYDFDDDWLKGFKGKIIYNDDSDADLNIDNGGWGEITN